MTPGWGAIAALLAVAALAFWLGRTSAGGGRDDLSGPPPLPKPPGPRARPAASFGAGPAQLEAAQRDAIVGALARGNKIMAIKLMREATGMGLGEAKHAVEAMELGR